MEIERLLQPYLLLINQFRFLGCKITTLKLVFCIKIRIFKNYEQAQIFRGMACVWRLHRNRRENGHCHQHHQKVFYLYFLPYHGFAIDCISIRGILDECKKVCKNIEKKPSGYIMLKRLKMFKKFKMFFRTSNLLNFLNLPNLLNLFRLLNLQNLK